MIKCILLIPLRYNDGTEVARQVIIRFMDGVYDKFGGISQAGKIRGVYRMADGSRAIDEMLEVWVGLEPDQVPALERMAAQLASTLHQESVWLEVGAADIRLVRPDQESEEE